MNVSHIDKDDKVYKARLDKLKQEAIKNDRMAALKVLNSGLFCIPTTCAYQFVYGSESAREELSPSQYFALNGIGIALKIVDGIGHHFLGATVSHRSCLCICRNIDGLVCSRNEDNNFLVVGWGACGGNDEAESDDEGEGANSDGSDDEGEGADSDGSDVEAEWGEI